MNWTGFAYLIRREFMRFLEIVHTTILPSIISGALFILVFGIALARGGEIAGLPYSAFILPGILIMNLINAPLHNASFSVFEARWHGHIKERLAAPLMHKEHVLSVVIASVLRGFIVSGALLLLFAPFIEVAFAHPVFAFAVAVITAFAFGCAGVIIGLWANDWDGMFIMEPFILLPLTFLGGVFYSIRVLPEFWQKVSLFNPFLYIIDAFRYGLTGVNDTNPWIGLGLVCGLAVVLYGVAHHLYKTGWNLRD